VNASIEQRVDPFSMSGDRDTYRRRLEPNMRRGSGGRTRRSEDRTRRLAKVVASGHGSELTSDGRTREQSPDS